MRLQIPATLASLGPSRNACSLALSLYLNASIEDSSDEWIIQTDTPEYFQASHQKLLIDSIKQYAPRVKPHLIKINSAIPTTQGLGSRIAAIAAGVEIANRLGDLALTPLERIQAITDKLPHAEQAAAVVFGSFTTATILQNRVIAVRHYFPETSVLVFSPKSKFELTDKKPVIQAFSEAVEQSTRTNVLIASIINGDLELAGQILNLDLPSVTNSPLLQSTLADFRHIGRKAHAYGSFCTAYTKDPAIITLLPSQDLATFTANLDLRHQGEWTELSVEQNGIQVF